MQMATLDQRRETLDPNISVRDTLTGGRGDSVFVGGQTRHVVGYMKDFLFGPSRPALRFAALSGGERGRLTLARALAKPSNLLVLDEPTNDLDLETLDLLEEMIDDYPGTVLLVSHDRDFLDRTVSAVVVAEGDGRWNVYAGGYTDMVAQRGEGVTAKAVRRSRRGRAREPERPCTSAPKARLIVQRQARAGNAARAHRGARSRDREAHEDDRRSRTSTPATAPPSTRRPRRSARRRPNSPRPKTNGCGSRNCGSRWKRDSSAVIPAERSDGRNP